MREAVIVSYARTGLAKSGRGGFNITPPMSMAAHAIQHAVERAGVSVNRFCSSGLQTIAMVANSIRSGGADRIVAGGVESISIPGGAVPKESIDPDLLIAAPAIFMAMIDTADKLGYDERGRPLLPLWCAMIVLRIIAWLRLKLTGKRLVLPEAPVDRLAIDLEEFGRLLSSGDPADMKTIARSMRLSSDPKSVKKH